MLCCHCLFTVLSLSLLHQSGTETYHFESSFLVLFQSFCLYDSPYPVRVRSSVLICHSHRPNWSPNSPDMNSVYYSLWKALQQMAPRVPHFSLLVESLPDPQIFTTLACRLLSVLPSQTRIYRSDLLCSMVLLLVLFVLFLLCDRLNCILVS